MTEGESPDDSTRPEDESELPSKFQVAVQNEASRVELSRTQNELRSRFRDQKIAIASVLATAVLGIVGSTTTLMVANNQINSQAQESAASFKREQQLTAYSNYLTAVDKFGSAQGRFLSSLDLCQGDSFNLTVLPEYKNWDDAYQEANQKFNVVNLVGSQGAVQAAEALMDQISFIRSASADYCTRRSRGEQEKPQDPAFFFESGLIDKKNDFSQKARSDFS